jgi:hypothetical protein
MMQKHEWPRLTSIYSIEHEDFIIARHIHSAFRILPLPIFGTLNFEP